VQLASLNISFFHSNFLCKFSERYHRHGIVVLALRLSDPNRCAELPGSQTRETRKISDRYIATMAAAQLNARFVELSNGCAFG
jgi:hypothetical protein